MPDKKMEFRSLKFKVENKSEEDDFLYFSGYASTFGNTDLDGDIFDPEAFDESLRDFTPKMLLMHNSRSVPVGVFTSLKTDSKGLFVEGKLPLDDDRVKGMIAPQMKLGSLDAMSVGFYTVVAEYDNETDIRTFKKVDLKEISLVTFPANEQARVTAVKHILDDPDITKDERAEIRKLFSEKTEQVFVNELFKSFSDDLFDSKESIESWKKHSDSDTSPSDTYKNGFLHHAITEKDSFDNYKYPIMQFVDGEQKASKRAIVSARASIEGSKGGPGIPLDQIQTLAKNINKYYELIGLEPFEKDSKWSLPEIKLLGKSDLEFIIRSGNLSRSSSNYIASAVLSTLEETGTHTEDEADISKLAEIMDKTLNKKE